MPNSRWLSPSWWRRSATSSAGLNTDHLAGVPPLLEVLAGELADEDHLAILVVDLVDQEGTAKAGASKLYEVALANLERPAEVVLGGAVSPLGHLPSPCLDDGSIQQFAVPVKKLFHRQAAFLGGRPGPATGW